MHRTIIVAHIRPNAESSVAEVFAKSDATSLPLELDVQRRSLYRLNDLYLHVVDFHNDPVETLRRATKLPGFRQISDDLKPFIHPYDAENWHTPQDAVAKEFYRWDAMS